MAAPRARRAFLLLVPLLALLTTGPAAAATSPDGIWSDAAEPTVTGERLIRPLAYRVVRLDGPALTAVLDAAPLERQPDTADQRPVLTLPLPDGGFGRFALEESPVMAPELGRKFPEIRTFRGLGLDDPTAVARIDRTPAGFHAMILGAGGSIFIDPYARGEATLVQSYFKRDYARTGSFECTAQRGIEAEVVPVEAVSSGDTLRTYRLALAATAEYTGFHGGTVVDGMAAIVTTMNRVNGIYERDVAIFMELVPDNDTIVYTNTGMDGYTNGNGFAMLGQNQSNLDSEIGSANYDIGHVFSTGGGGVAGFQVVCKNSSKAQGVTGQSTPIGDPFDVDYVAHEMGHQWGGDHTFNGTAGSCGGQRWGPAAYEPGSGSTIMAYAGICGSQNLQPNSDAHFVVHSFDQIVGYSTTGTGSTCAVETATGNTPPSVDAGVGHTIPLDTPFTLCGSATDLEDVDLLYGWEQYDLGPAGRSTSPSGNAPIFRSFPPVDSQCRTFPRLDDILTNTATIGELLPTYARTLTFRLTVRDQHAGGGGLAYDDVTLDVTDLAGPFQVTAPDTAVSWTGLDLQAVTWNVAGTDLPPVDCADVDILFSEDGGASFPTALALATPNDGSEIITVPDVSTSQARIQVACSDSIFFDVGNADFSVAAPVPSPAGAVPDGGTFPGTQLTVVHAGGGDVTLAWGDSCVGADSDFEVYAGAVGSYASHVPVTCSTAGALLSTFTPGAGSEYYLVVPRNTLREGHYGVDSSGAARPASAGACVTQEVGFCDL